MTSLTSEHVRHPHRILRLGAVFAVGGAAIAAIGCAGHAPHAKRAHAPEYRQAATSGRAVGARESIYVLRSIREEHRPSPNGCAPAIAGFEPFARDGERFYSFWSVRVRGEDGRLDDAHVARVASLRGCFGATDDRARQNFYAEITLGAITLIGRGECLALGIDVPEPGLFPVRCQLVLRSPTGAYAGGTLTTNTVTSRASFGGESDPPGYAQASIATIRLWDAR